MFKALSASSWWGGTEQAEEESLFLVPGDESQPPPPDGAAEAEAILEQARGVGSYLRNVATSATKKVSDSMRETAQTIKKSVEEHKIDNLLDKANVAAKSCRKVPETATEVNDQLHLFLVECGMLTRTPGEFALLRIVPQDRLPLLEQTIIGNFKKEQEKFVKEQKLKKSDAALPPWAGYNEEETVRRQILSLSAERRNFLRDPPAGVQFNFDFDGIAPVAIVMLREDEVLSKMRFELVPKLVKEEQFWRNYFYRVSLIKQSAQLSSLAARQAEGSKEELECLENSIASTDSTLSKTPPVPVKKQNESVEVHPLDEISTSPIANEFVSDAYDTSLLNQEDLLKGMEQLGMSGGQPAPVEDDDLPEWEKELQRELQEFEIVDVKANVSDAWEKEIEELLQEDD